MDEDDLINEIVKRIAKLRAKAEAASVRKSIAWYAKLLKIDKPSQN